MYKVTNSFCFFLAEFYKASRATRIADGPDEVHLRAIARLETRKTRLNMAKL